MGFACPWRQDGSPTTFSSSGKNGTTLKTEILGGATTFITMEFVPGENLKSCIHRSKQLSTGTAISIAKQVCEGLEEVHRMYDPFPANIRSEPRFKKLMERLKYESESFEV
jgi:serine/threonine protein kinase